MHFLLKMGIFHCYVSLPEGSFYYLVLFSFLLLQYSSILEVESPRKSHWFRLVSYYRWTNWVKFIYIHIYIYTIYEISREFSRHPTPRLYWRSLGFSLKLPKRCFFFFSRVLKPKASSFFRMCSLDWTWLKTIHTTIHASIYLYIFIHIFIPFTHIGVYLNYFKHSTYHIDLQVGCNRPSEISKSFSYINQRTYIFTSLPWASNCSCWKIAGFQSRRVAATFDPSWCKSCTRARTDELRKIQCPSPNESGLGFPN